LAWLSSQGLGLALSGFGFTISKPKQLGLAWLGFGLSQGFDFFFQPEWRPLPLGASYEFWGAIEK
jgi:hypothetical protein